MENPHPCRWKSFYQQDPKAGWVPKSWNFTWQSLEGLPRVSFTTDVCEYQINPSVPETTFEIKIPVDTLVIDSSMDAENPKTYVQREGNRLFKVPPGVQSYKEALELARKADTRK